MEEAKKMKYYKTLIYKQFVQVRSLWPTVSELLAETFHAPLYLELRIETPYWCTVLLHQYGRRKSTKIPAKTPGVHFFYKSSFFCLRASSPIWASEASLARTRETRFTRSTFFVYVRIYPASRVASIFPR